MIDNVIFLSLTASIKDYKKVTEISLVFQTDRQIDI